MENALDFFLLLVRQFAGGPGPVENNLVRFGLPAVLWGALLLVAWSRQRTQKLPRERLLVWGFGLGFAREMFMFLHVAGRILSQVKQVEAGMHQPVEHALAMAAIVVVAGAFLRYILDDERLARRYLQAGLGTTVAGFGLVSWTWPRTLVAHPELQFHQSWQAWLFHLPLSVLIFIAIYFLGRKRGWLRNVVILALVFFFLGEVLMLTNYTTDRAYDYVVCPIGNIFHILAIPLLGYVYLREQAIEKRRAERALEAYRDHLEDLVQERTAENERLYQEAQRRATELAHLHQASIFLASTLDADEIYDQIVLQSVELVDCQAACVLLQPGGQTQIEIASCHGLDDLKREAVRALPGVSALLEDLLVHRQSIVVSDSATDPRVPALWIEKLDLKALLCLPIGSTQDRLGFLFLMDTRATRQWRTEEIELVESFANRAAVALVNASLHEQIEWAAALEERQRIAADMHDGLGQTLSLLGLRVDRASELVATGSDGESLQELHRIRELIELVSHDVRRSIASLQETPRPRRSLQDQLADLIEQYASDDKPPIHPAISIQDPLLLSPDYNEQILPIVQEALLNAFYHAQATRIELTLERQADQVRISVQDDGRGFDPAATQSNGEGHFGLSIMRARAARIGAELRMDSQPGRGTRVVLTWAQTAQNVQSSGVTAQPQPKVQPEPALEAGT